MPSAAAGQMKEKVSKMHKEVLRPLLARISARLEAGGPRRVTGDFERRTLAFLKMELADTAVSLMDNQVDDRLLEEWLDRLSRLADYTDGHLRRTDPPGGHALLRRATQCFCSGRPDWSWFALAEGLFMFTEHPCRYRPLLLPAGSDLGLPLVPHQAAAETGDHPLVGIDSPRRKLSRWLTPRADAAAEKSLRVMCIVGPAGIGKTTLAMELRKRVTRRSSGRRRYFQCDIVTQMSQRTDRCELLLQDIRSQILDVATPALSPHQSQPKAIELLVSCILKHLQDKRYFIIINDIRDTKDWDIIKSAFPNNDMGSRILITTRTESIARSCCSGYEGLVHEMKPLNEIDSERLLLAKAFGSIHGCLSDNVKLVVDKILVKCEGIPLFITGMADWLKEKLQQHNKEEVEFECRFGILGEEEVPPLLEQFRQALSATYDDLPYELRLLSLYMSMFPRGYILEKGCLAVRGGSSCGLDGVGVNEGEEIPPYYLALHPPMAVKWLVEGMVHRKLHPMIQAHYLRRLRYESLIEINMDKAEDFFWKLVDTKVITRVPATCNKRNLNEAGACKWHVNHFMLQFLTSKAAEIGFIFTSATLNLAEEASSVGSGNKTRIPRRLALHYPVPDLSLRLQRMDLSRILSLAVSGSVDVGAIPLEKFVNLVVLDLEGWENVEDKHLLDVCTSNMFFLEYLSVRNTRISELPHEIKELHSLRVLDVSHTQISELPFELFELTLEQLDLRGTRIRQLPKEIAAMRRTLLVLLVGDEGMNNSTETATRVPHDISLMHNLHTLATIDLRQHPASFVQALGNIPFLRELVMTLSFHECTDGAYREALSSIGKWLSLESLTIHCGLGCSMEFLGSQMSDRPSKLKKFKVTEGRFACVPKWVNKELKDLTFLQITVCKHGTDDLKILGELPSLQCLILGLDFIPGEAIGIEGVGFHKLQRFSLQCPMPWLTFEVGAMPNLTYLQMEFCATPASQTRVPSGISNLRRLTEVALCYNAQYINSPSIKITVEAVTKQVAEHRSPVELSINGIEQDDVEASDEETEDAMGSPSGTDAGAGDGVHAADEKATAAVHSEIIGAEC